MLKVMINPALVFGLAAALLAASVVLFVYFIRLNKGRSREYSRKVKEYNKAVEALRKEEMNRRAQAEKAANPVKVEEKPSEPDVSLFPRRIQFMAPSGASYDVPILYSMTIGKDPQCDLVVDNASVSAFHCKITYSDGHYFAEDMGSENGTSFDGNEIVSGKKTEIKTGVFQVGRVTFFMTIDKQA